MHATPELQVLLSRRLRLSEGSGQQQQQQPQQQQRLLFDHRRRRNVAATIRGTGMASSSFTGSRGMAPASSSYTAPRGLVHKLLDGERTTSPRRRSPGCSFLQRRDPPGSPVGSLELGPVRQNNGDGRSMASNAAAPGQIQSQNSSRGNSLTIPPLPPGEASQASRHNGPAWVENLVAKRRADCAATQGEDKAGAILKELRGRLTAESEKAQDLSARLRRQQRCREMDAAMAEQRCQSLREECAELQTRSHALAEKCTENEARNKCLVEECTEQRLRRRVLEEECRGFEEAETRYIEECAQAASRNRELVGQCTEYQALSNALRESQSRIVQECTVHQIESHSLLEEFKQHQESHDHRRHGQGTASLVAFEPHMEPGHPASAVASRSPALACKTDWVPAVWGPQSWATKQPHHPHAAPPDSSATTFATDAGVEDQWMCSESRLRSVMTSHNASTEDLRQAIRSVDALLSEAKRELAARELRERRAAYEQLHDATEGRKEEALEVAISVARKVGIDEEDITRAEGRLEQLRSMSAEDRAAQEAHVDLLERKRRAFQLVKQGKDSALRQLLSETVSMDVMRDENHSVSKQWDWRQWKDHAGRTLVAYAKELRAVPVQDCLERVAIEQEEPPRDPERSPEPSQDGACTPKQRPDLVLAQQLDDKGTSSGVATPNTAPWVLVPKEPSTPTRPPRPSWPLQTGVLNETLKTEAALCTPSDESSALQFLAFRAVVRDDTEKLGEILQKVPQDVWSNWQNKAGKDLLTLAQERGSSGSQSMVAKALGLVKERRRESFEERETVWVLFPGEVQARHATVLEDVPETAGDVLLELWDCNDPPTRVNRGIVLKAE